MKMLKAYNILMTVAITIGMVACTDDIGTGNNGVVDNSQIIRVGIDGSGLTYTAGTGTSDISNAKTRAADDVVRAETVEWLKGALRSGIDVTYSNMNNNFEHVAENEHVAILKWTGNVSDAGRGVYTFDYKGETDAHGKSVPAKWYNNGPHYFEGQYVPEQIRTTGESLTGDGKAQNLNIHQYDGNDFTYDKQGQVTDGTIGNYTMLSHYIGMPPSWYHSATIDQVLLPFKHRLSRVIVYVLIDPLLNTTIKGYNATLSDDGKTLTTPDDPMSTELRFCNVKVLDYVKETPATQESAATLTPKWTTGRKVVPHFLGELNGCYNSKEQLVADDDDAKDNFIVYTKNSNLKKIHPREKEWIDAHNAYKANPTTCGYTRNMYKRAAVYDVIVRPTYTENDSVMYDEAGYYTVTDGVRTKVRTKNESVINALCAQQNSIDFEMTLASGLTYSKRFEFDLNANWQTVVYLTIDREGVDYDASTSEKWEEAKTNDGYYGPNNDLGHNLSIAGSSWHRAYRNGSLNVSVTDGNQYTEKDNLGQYVSDAAWIEHFAQAYEGGANHGDYFVLDKDITINMSALPKDFVFTGHLDARCHKITIEGCGTWAVATSYLERELPLYEKNGEEYKEYNLPDLYIPEEVAQGRPRKSETIGKGDDMMKLVEDRSLQEIMTDNVDYYVKTDDSYVKFTRPTLYRKTATTLFAGLDANYTTPQESNASLSPDKWLANVHQERNNGKTYWVPLAGYRAELLNVNLSGGRFFPTWAENTVTGYIYNCKEGETSVSNNPEIPAY